MKKFFQILTILTIISVLTPSVVCARNASIPHSFTSNSKAFAKEVNENFEELETSVNSKQDRIVGECPVGQSIRVIQTEGTCICEEDDVGVTSVNVGSGLSSSTIDSSVMLDIATDGVESAHIKDGTITDEDISASASIDVMKIFGDVGFNFNKPLIMTEPNPPFGDKYLPQEVPVNDPNIKILKVIEIIAPSEGYVLLYHSGFTVFEGDGKTIEVGISSSEKDLIFGYGLEMGNRTGLGTDTYIIPYNVVALENVEAGSNKFFALAKESVRYNSNKATVYPKYFIALFINSSKRYNK